MEVPRVLQRVFGGYANAYRGLPPAVWWLAFVSLINRAGTMVIVFLPVWLIEVHHFSEAEATASISLWGLGSVVGIPIGGWLADRVGAVHVQFWSFVGVGVLFVVLAPQTEPAVLIGLLLAIGLVGEAFRPANDALLTSLCPPAERTRAFALNRLAINLGWAVGPVAGGLLSTWSWNLLFWVDASTCFLAAVLLVRWFSGRGRHAAATSNEVSASVSSAMNPWRDRLYLAMLLCLFGGGVVFMQFFSTMTVYLNQELHWSNAKIGLIEALNPVLIVALEMVLIQRFKRLPNPLGLIARGLVLTGIGFGALCVTGNPVWIALCVLVFTLGEILMFPLTSGFVANRAPVGARGRYMALQGGLFSVSLVVAPLFGAWGSQALGWRWFWIACGGLCLVSAVGMWRVAAAFDRELARG